MTRESIDDLEVLLTVAQEASFTRAAARLGVSQSALSQTVRLLEERIGLRLLDRTTRSVSPTHAGARLLETVAPRLVEIREEILGDFEIPFVSCIDARDTHGRRPGVSGQLPDPGLDDFVNRAFRPIDRDRAGRLIEVQQHLAVVRRSEHHQPGEGVPVGIADV